MSGFNVTSLQFVAHNATELGTPNPGGAAAVSSFVALKGEFRSLGNFSEQQPFNHDDSLAEEDALPSPKGKSRVRDIRGDTLKTA